MPIFITSDVNKSYFSPLQLIIIIKNIDDDYDINNRLPIYNFHYEAALTTVYGDYNRI